MIVHISLFFLKDPGTAGEMVAALEQVPRDNPAISTSLVGRNLVVLPPMPGVPEFADVAQVITFEDPADADAYAESPAHLALRAATDHLVERVVGAEFRQE